MAVQIGKEQIKNNAVDSTKLDGSSNYSFSGQMRYTGSDAKHTSTCNPWIRRFSCCWT